MKSGLFLTTPGCDSLRYTPTSIFAPASASEAEVFASVASSIQALRSYAVTKKLDKPALGTPHFPVATTLDLEPKIYTDSLIKASLMRAARPYELILMDDDLEHKRSESALLDLTAAEPKLHDISAELILASLSGKFPRLDLERAGSAMQRLGLTELFNNLI